MRLSHATTTKSPAATGIKTLALCKHISQVTDHVLFLLLLLLHRGIDGGGSAISVILITVKYKEVSQASLALHTVYEWLRVQLFINITGCMFSCVWFLVVVGFFFPQA